MLDPTVYHRPSVPKAPTHDKNTTSLLRTLGITLADTILLVAILTTIVPVTIFTMSRAQIEQYKARGPTARTQVSGDEKNSIGAPVQTAYRCMPCFCRLNALRPKITKHIKPAALIFFRILLLLVAIYTPTITITAPTAILLLAILTLVRCASASQRKNKKDAALVSKAAYKQLQKRMKVMAESNAMQARMLRGLTKEVVALRDEVKRIEAQALGQEGWV
ncbi:hypothetical protein J1614_002362 [Plenodomus biglobosus]|nr:hypothetical protein J1614_002362 [Plenodomus biglobosus]